MDKVSNADAHIFLFSAAMGLFEHFYRETGLDFNEYCSIIKGNHADEWIDLGKAKAISIWLLGKEMDSPGHLVKLIRAFEVKKEAFLEMANELESSDLERLTDEDLMGMYGTFLSLYHLEYCLPILTLFYKDHLSELLYERLLPKIGDRTAEVLSYITTPETESFSFMERRSMFTLMGQVYDRMGKSLFERSPEEILAALKQEEPALYEQLVELSHRYFWINNNYRRVIVLGPLDFIRKMKDESLSFDHPREELQIMERTRRDALERKKEHLEPLGKEERTMAYLLSEGGAWQDERKKCNLIADHVLMRFLEEVSRRTGHPMEVMRNVTTAELAAVLRGSADMAEIERRHEQDFSFYSKVHGRYVETVMEPGRRYEESEVEHAKELRGTPASHGKVEGEVIVITREDEFSKMKDGTILVSVMTRPEYVPLMKRAKGLITDEGGLTCHAAVVSREFRIPCVVGTRKATRILKDGDLVELDADKGLITLRS
jgi:phosphohistidine swiveling domain-containing protein